MKQSLLLIISLMFTNLLAEEGDSSETKKDESELSTIKGNVEFGYVASSGNTETTNMNGKFHIEAAYNNWVQQFDAATFFSSNDENTTAERFMFVYQGDRKFSDTSYYFVNAAYEEDKFSGYDYRASITTGYGRVLYNQNKMTLDGEIGIGARQSETDVVPLTGLSSKETEGMVKFALKYLWQMEDKRSLTSKLNIDAGEKTTISNFEIAFITLITGDLSMKASYVARHTSEVPEGKEKLDTVTTLNLLYAF